jgi:hypothetical protein
MQDVQHFLKSYPAPEFPAARDFETISHRSFAQNQIVSLLWIGTIGSIVIGHDIDHATIGGTCFE